MAHCTVATTDSLRELGASKRHAFNQIINRFQIGVWESEIACSNTVPRISAIWSEPFKYI